MRSHFDAVDDGVKRGHVLVGGAQGHRIGAVLILDDILLHRRARWHQDGEAVDSRLRSHGFFGSTSFQSPRIACSMNHHAIVGAPVFERVGWVCRIV